MNELLPSTYSPQIGDLVRIEGTYQSDMPDSMVALVIEKDSRTMWWVSFTNGIVLRIWEGHMTPLTIT
jgi:hypothetical protein